MKFIFNLLWFLLVIALLLFALACFQREAGAGQSIKSTKPPRPTYRRLQSHPTVIAPCFQTKLGDYCPSFPTRLNGSGLNYHPSDALIPFAQEEWFKDLQKHSQKPQKPTQHKRKTNVRLSTQKAP